LLRLKEGKEATTTKNKNKEWRRFQEEGVLNG